MQKEPFIIMLDNEDLPNLSQSEDGEFSFEYRQTNLWQDDSSHMLKLLADINEKLDIVIRIMKQSGKG